MALQSRWVAMMRVLVTDGAMNKSLTVVRAIADVATEIGVSSRFPVSPAGLSRHADASYWVRDRAPEAYIDTLNRIGRAGEYDQLLPVGGRSFEVVSTHRDRLRFPIDTILPTPEAMGTAVDKQATHALAEREGIPSPATVAISNRSMLDAVPDRIGYPAVFKTGVETESRFIRIVESSSQLQAAYDAYRRDHESDPIVQEHLPGIGRGYFGFYVDGDLAGGYAHRRVREYPPEGGASACAESLRDDELRTYSERLLSALDWNGVAMVEFKESETGTPKIIEINPKFWGSLDLAIESGMNFPRALLQHAAGRTTVDVDFDFEFRPRRVHWPLSGDLTHAFRRPRSAPAVFADLVSPRTQSNLRFGDPLPHLAEGAITLFRRDV